MQELKVIGVESGALLVASDEGSRYRIAIDEVIQSRLRQAAPDTGTSRKLAPREIQAHIRAGMSAEDVASVTGASLEYIQRFEGPVLAEREYVIESALGIPVHTAVEIDPLTGGATFGTVIGKRLADAGAIDERWASWKEQDGGWIVKLTFTAEQVDHDARWGFDPKKSALAPLNPEAVSLSQQGDLPASLVPRLRAVVPTDDTTRFDSGAFEMAELEPDGSSPRSTAPLPRIAPAAEEEAPTLNQTADLLEALRRRRGERDPMDPSHEESIAAHPSTGAVRLIDIPLDTPGEPPVSSGDTPPSGSPHNTGPLGKSRRGRPTMPSWDEIVFGARPDDDL